MYIVSTEVIEEIKTSISKGYTIVEVGMISPRTKGVMLCNENSEVRGTYPLGMKSLLELLIDAAKT